MASDEESTRPIEIDALRSSLPTSGGAGVSSTPDVAAVGIDTELLDRRTLPDGAAAAILPEAAAPAFEPGLGPEAALPAFELDESPAPDDSPGPAAAPVLAYAPPADTAPVLEVAPAPASTARTLDDARALEDDGDGGDGGGDGDGDGEELARTRDDLGDSSTSLPPVVSAALADGSAARRPPMPSIDRIALRVSDADIVLSPDEDDVQLLPDSAADIPAAIESADVIEELSPDEIFDEEDEEESPATVQEPPPPRQRTARPPPPARQASAPPPPPPPPGPTTAYQPPAPAVRAARPAHEIDADEGEQQLQREGDFRALVDLYRLRLAEADTPARRAALLHRIASVHEHRLGEPDVAFTALAEAFFLRPADAEIVDSLERVAKELGRVGELADSVRARLQTPDLELKVTLLGHLVYWYERVLGRGSEVTRVAAELERIDRTHPVALRRFALTAAANGDVKSQRELLQRALERTSRAEEKAHLYLALASAYAGTAEAAKHYEAVLAIDPGSIVALQGLERIGREQDKHAQVEWCLERQVEAALTTAERTDALLKLADLHETKYLKREKAAEILERVIESEPSHPEALKILERCYHALRDWPRLAKVLRARAENTYDKEQKVELLELAAEVFESKLGDSASAIDAHRDVLMIDQKHRRALADLARLYEKAGDWPNIAMFKARSAELAPSKRQASQQLVQLGDMLSPPERDPGAARVQYERAVVVDPTNASAWEALQRVAAAAGDDRRVAQCLEQRVDNTDAPRQRAVILVELANFHLGRGAERAARESFEAAISADATNEAAAVAMLDAYTRDEQWAPAAPLCELLVNAAKRDSDARALFTRLRLATRIGAALGDRDRAMTSALAALDIEPEDQGAQADLVAVCSQCRDQPEVVGRAKECLTRIASGPTALPAGLLLALAQLQRDGAELDLAAQTLERARAADPDNAEIVAELSAVYLAHGDFARCCKLKMDLARSAVTPAARFRLLCETGEIWARKAGELDKAATIFEEARALEPLDHWLLHTLLWLYGELQRWDDLSTVLESVAQLQETPEKKATSLFAMAQIAHEKLDDPVRAAALFDQVLELDHKRLAAFEQLVRALTEAKDWALLERSYRKMIGRIKADPQPNDNLLFALFHQLGLIYRDRLENAAAAYEALDAAAQLRPDDAVVRKIVIELLVVTDNLESAVDRTRDLIDRNPHDAELYAELYELFLRQRFFDKAWCAVNVLAQMREPTAEQRRFHEDYAPVPLSEVPGQIIEAAWRSHLLHKDLDETLTKLFARMTPAVARMRYAHLRPEQLVQAAGRPFTGAHSRLHPTVRAAFTNAAEILHMSAPELLLGDPASAVPFAPALSPFGAVHVSVPAIEARADTIVYVVGKRMAEQRPELFARAFFPSVSELTGLLAAAVRLARQEGANDAAGAALDASLGAVLMPQERDALRTIVTQATHAGEMLDVKRWSQAADLSSMRAGLLLAGDVAAARRAIMDEPQATADLSPREKVGELYKFATSDLHADLRGAIGVAVKE